ncbi:MAG TPA: CBS domain-containing protein [Candidatus Caldiarchaeum subterraneum]|uniref:CBS domain-containing protein n=1 Tax=Caldiarchaeum subterraneum TaxID=311458 RepID=A0A833E9X3_CALS0|nr:CBS domain-containing protein [Candidatus Caldarchaeum subterraneum]
MQTPEVTVGDIMQHEFESVHVDEPLTKVSGIFSTKDIPIVVVVDDNREFYGVLVERVLLRPHLNIAETKAGTLAVKTPYITRDTSIYDATRRMVENNLKALPVTEGKKPIGIVSVHDIAEASKEVLRRIKVREVMTDNPISVSVSDTIGKAISLMRENGISRLPVLNRNKLAGIVTVHDIIEKVIKPRERATRGEISGEKAKTLSNKIKDIMTTPVYTALPDDTLATALERMKQHDISCLVVVKDSNVTGIITLMDILSPLAAYGEERREGIMIQVSYNKLPNIPHEDKNRVMEMAERFVKKLEESLGNGYLTLYFKEHKEKHGEMHLIHCRARLKTDKYQFVGTGEAWRADFAAREALSRIERQILIRKELARRYPYVDEIFSQLVDFY